MGICDSPNNQTAAVPNQATPTTNINPTQVEANVTTPENNSTANLT